MDTAALNDQPSSTRRHLNAEEKRRVKAADIQLFARLYARPAQKGVEPNDRRYPRDIERQVKRMRPDELDSLLRDED
jgi:hypothetical protein